VDRPHITNREWRSVALFAVAIMLLTTVPYLSGAAAQGGGLRFGWFMFGVDDGNSYLAKMRQGAVDGWLFHIVYTAEPHDGAFLFTPYLAGGKLAALLAPPSSPAFVDSMLLVFHASRIVFGILLILVVYRFIAAFIVKRSLRWLALILICLGGGLGWLLTVFGLGDWLGSPPVDLILPEGYTFYLLYGLPHLSLARAALLGGLMLIFHALTLDRARRWLPWALLAGLCWVVMGLCVPFYVAVLYAILGVWGLAALLRHRRFPTTLFWRCTVGALVPAPLLVYNTYVFATNPIMGAWSGQNVLPSPHPLHYVFGYGLLAALALPAIRWAWQRGMHKTPYLLLPAWVIAGPVLAYLPIGVQRRLLEGIFVPLCILATMGLRFWWIGLRRRHDRRMRVSWRGATVGVVLLTVPTTFLLLLFGMLAIRWHDPGNRLFNAENEIAALDWLNTHGAADSIVLSDFNTGNYVPARTGMRAMIGHGPETIGLGAKLAQAQKFFAGQMSAEERRAFLNTYRIRYVIFPGGQIAINAADLSLIYDQDSYHIYEVR
jgi:hypothetical protein